MLHFYRILYTGRFLPPVHLTFDSRTPCSHNRSRRLCRSKQRACKQRTLPGVIYALPRSVSAVWISDDHPIVGTPADAACANMQQQARGTANLRYSQPPPGEARTEDPTAAKSETLCADCTYGIAVQCKRGDYPTTGILPQHRHRCRPASNRGKCRPNAGECSRESPIYPDILCNNPANPRHPAVGQTPHVSDCLHKQSYFQCIISLHCHFSHRNAALLD